MKRYILDPKFTILDKEEYISIQPSVLFATKKPLHFREF